MQVPREAGGGLVGLLARIGLLVVDAVCHRNCSWEVQRLGVKATSSPSPRGVSWLFAWVQHVFSELLHAWFVDRQEPLGISASRPPTCTDGVKDEPPAPARAPHASLMCFGSRASDISNACKKPWEGPRRWGIIFRSLRCGFVPL